MTRVRLAIFLFTIIFVVGVGWFISLLARGYKFDTKTFLRPSGLLVLDSEPNGAQIFINGELESATDDSISLTPGIYDVEVRKDGFLTWRKKLTIKKEEVTQAEIYLFPAAPSLSPLTFTGVEKPLLSPDRTKIIYGVPKRTNGKQSDKQQIARNTDKTGIWLRDLIDLPIGFSREAHQVTNLDPSQIVLWAWSPDSREIYLETANQQFLLPINDFTPKTQLVSISQNALKQSIESWRDEVSKKRLGMLKKLPKIMQEVIKDKTSAYVFSPDEKKVMYTANDDFVIPESLITPLPGSSTQKEERDIKSGRTYIYDIKEDKNFLIYENKVNLNNHTALDILEAENKEQSADMESSPTASLYWFPTSNHVILAEKGKIIIMDYDGTNRQIVYAGPYQAPYAIPYPNPSRILFLTNLGAGENALPNLYTLSFK